MQFVTKFQGGRELMELTGFCDKTNTEGVKVWINLGSVSYLKGVRLDLAAGFK